MKSFLYSLAVLSFASFGLVACGGDSSESGCKEYCDKIDECSGSSEEELEECKDDCADEAKDVDTANCASEVSAYYDCINDLECDDDDDDCDSELDDATDCLENYCNDSDSDDDICDE